MRRFVSLVLLACLGSAMPVAAPADPVPGAQAMLNRMRAEQGRRAVTPAPRLQRAAETHAAAMAQSGSFSHTGPDGRSVGGRVRAQGYRFCFVAENIAWGQRGLGRVMTAWAESPGHARNMFSGKATEFGLARAPGDIWVMVLGRSGC